MTRRYPWKKKPSTPPPQHTAARRPASFVQGEHEFHIAGYSAPQRLAVPDAAADRHHSILSAPFDVGGYTWALECIFLDDDHDVAHLASIALLLLNAYIVEDAVVAKAGLRIEDPLGRWPAAVWESDGEAYTFHVWSGNSWQLSQDGRSRTLSVPDAFRDHESRYVQDDSLTILCTVEVLREEEQNSSVAGDMEKLLFLKSNSKMTSFSDSRRRKCMLPVPDVTFVVDQAEIEAHRLILAMRSPVFAAELLGDMRESTTRRIVVDDMSASTFRAMLRFIYTDKLPIKDNTKDVASRSQRGCKEKCAARRRLDMVLDLLIDADRYDLEKLRLMCEKMLSESIDAASVIPTLMVVHGRQSCHELEASCIKYLAFDDNVYASVIATKEYKDLKESCRLFIANVSEKVATCKLVAGNSSLDANTSSQRSKKRSMSTYNTSEVVHLIHDCKIPNFKSLQMSHGVRQTLKSENFQIGGYEWKLEVWTKKGKLSVFAELLTDPGMTGVSVSLVSRLDDPSGKSLPYIGQLVEIFGRTSPYWGFSDFIIPKGGIVSPYHYLAQDGSLTIRCDLVVTQKACTGSSAGVEDMTLTPPPNIASHLEQLLVTEKGSDVTFLFETFEFDRQSFAVQVKKRKIYAHSIIIATRCPALYGTFVATNQKEEEVIVPVSEMRFAVFKAVLHFIYTDELPPLEDIALDAGHGVLTIADILDAARRFGLNKMKDKCERLLGESVSRHNVMGMIGVAGHHDCMKLQDYCMKFK